MTSRSDDLVFVGSLPSEAPARRTVEPRYDALTERAGEWAEWWGDVPQYVHKAAKVTRRDGFRFEAAIRNGRAYIRAVAA